MKHRLVSVPKPPAVRRAEEPSSMLEPAMRPRSAEPQSLRGYLAPLPDADIVRIAEPADIDYRPTALVLTLEKRQQTPVVMIERPIGFDMPIATNLFTSRDRIARMAEVEPGGFNVAWTIALEHFVPAGTVEIGPVQEIVRTGSEVDAATLPISHHFEKDAGGYIGSGIIICRDPDTGVRNLSYQRVQLKGQRSSAPACICAAISGNICNAAKRAVATCRSPS
jgi:UbiD family decarboxylase